MKLNYNFNINVTGRNLTEIALFKLFLIYNPIEGSMLFKIKKF